MSEKWTARPSKKWKAKPCSSGGGLILRGDNHPQPSIQVVPLEDAYKMGAADDLVAALSGLLDEIDDCAQPLDWEWYEPGRAALARARGE